MSRHSPCSAAALHCHQIAELGILHYELAMSAHRHHRLYHHGRSAMVAESARCGAAKATERLQVRTTDICSEATTRTGTPGHVHNIRGFLAPLSKACLLGAPAVATTDATLHAKVLNKVFLSVTREVHESGVAFEPTQRGTHQIPCFFKRRRDYLGASGTQPTSPSLWHSSSAQQTSHSSTLCSPGGNTKR